MAFSLIQAGSTLQFVDASGVITNLTLPTGVTLRTDVPLRTATKGNYVYLVNSPSTPLTVDALGVVRPLCPKPPASAAVISAVAGGTLSGTYGHVRYTFVVKDSTGAVIAESDFSPPSNTVTVANQAIKLVGVETSSEPISARRIYRGTTNGEVMFPWFEIDGNTITTAQDDLADAGLSILSAPTLGNPPRLTLIAEWRDRLWGVGDMDPNLLVFSRPDAPYAFPITYSIAIPSRDQSGIRSLMPRRDALGVGGRDVIWQITGDEVENFRAVKLSENTGVESNESVAIYRDTAFWLWKDGVYQWDSDGLRNISDGKVSAWFNTSDYFNQNLFYKAFGVVDPVRLKYRLYLAAAGSTAIDRWVEYDIQNKTWWGPHKTFAFSPASAFVLADAKDKTQAIVASTAGYIYKDTATRTDDAAYSIDFDVDTRWYETPSADYEKYFGELSVLGKVMPVVSGNPITITPYVGYMNATAGTAISYNMALGRQRLRRLGTGKVFRLNFRHSEIGENVELYGFQLPYHVLGRR